MILLAALIVFGGLNIGQGLFLGLLQLARLAIALGVRAGLLRPKRRVGSNARLTH